MHSRVARHRFVEDVSTGRSLRDLLHSIVYDVMNQVVFCVQLSMCGAYQAQQDDVGAFFRAIASKCSYRTPLHTLFYALQGPINSLRSITHGVLT